MSPLVMFILFIVNTLALAITLSVLILALWQNPGDAIGRAVSQFLAALAFYTFPAILLGIGVLLLGQVLALVQPIFREIGFASLSSIAASTILGYKLARMQLFNPLIMRTAQLAALRDVSRTLIGSQDLHKVLQVI